MYHLNNSFYFYNIIFTIFFVKLQSCIDISLNNLTIHSPKNFSGCFMFIRYIWILGWKKIPVLLLFVQVSMLRCLKDRYSVDIVEPLSTTEQISHDVFLLEFR